MKKHEMYCLVCDKELGPSINPSIFNDDRPEDIAPNDALVCYSIGNYGSTLYDPFKDADVQKLEFYVCDPCMREKQNKVYTVFGSNESETKPAFKHGIHHD